jgi:predicted oxidoreductase
MCVLSDCLHAHIVTQPVQTSPDDFEESDFRRHIPRCALRALPWRHRLPCSRARRYSKENFPNILKLTDALKTLGAAHGATAGQVTLAWLLAQGADVIPIPGTRTVKVRASCHPRRHFNADGAPVLTREPARARRPAVGGGG